MSSKDEDSDIIDQFFSALDNVGLTKIPDNEGPQVSMGPNELWKLYAVLRLEDDG